MTQVTPDTMLEPTEPEALIHSIVCQNHQKMNNNFH